MIGAKRKKRGLALVELSCAEFLAEMRTEAKKHAARHGYVTTDNLREYATMKKLRPDTPNAWGAIFKGSEWECVGRVPSRYRTNNARYICQWRMV